MQSWDKVKSTAEIANKYCLPTSTLIDNNAGSATLQAFSTEVGASASAINATPRSNWNMSVKVNGLLFGRQYTILKVDKNKISYSIFYRKTKVKRLLLILRIPLCKRVKRVREVARPLCLLLFFVHKTHKTQFNQAVNPSNVTVLNKSNSSILISLFSDLALLIGINMVVAHLLLFILF